jgi:hypothetical protein
VADMEAGIQRVKRARLADARGSVWLTQRQVSERSAGQT